VILIYCFHCVTTCVRYYYYYYRHRALYTVHDDNYTQFSASPWENYTLNYIIYSAYTYMLYTYNSGRISFDGVVLCDVYARRVSAVVGYESGWLRQSINGKLFPTQCGGCPDKCTHTYNIICAHARGRDHGNRHVINRRGASHITGVNKSFVFLT